MHQNSTIDIWHLLFEQTPLIIRALLGVLTMGVFTLAGWLWKLQDCNIRRIEHQIHTRIDRDMTMINDQIKRVDSKLERIMQHLAGV